MCLLIVSQGVTPVQSITKLACKLDDLLQIWAGRFAATNKNLLPIPQAVALHLTFFAPLHPPPITAGNVSIYKHAQAPISPKFKNKELSGSTPGTPRVKISHLHSSSFLH